MASSELLHCDAADQFVNALLEAAHRGQVEYDILGGLSDGHIDLTTSSDVDIICRSERDARQMSKLISEHVAATLDVTVVSRRKSSGGFDQWVLSAGHSVFMLDVLVGLVYENFTLLDSETYFELKAAGLDAKAIAKFLKRSSAFKKSHPHPPKFVYSMTMEQPSAAARAQFYARKIAGILKSLVAKRTGCLAVVLGPDGCGKTTVLESVWADLYGNRQMIPVEIYHWIPQHKRGGTNVAPVTDPHGKAPRGTVASLAKIALLLTRYSVGYISELWRRLHRGTLVIFDRYYHDMLIDPRRYRFGGPAGLARMAARFVPQPDIWIILGGDPEVFYRRKPETSVEEVRRQLDEYSKFAASVPNAHIVDATRLLDVVVQDVKQLLLRSLAERANTRE